MEVNIVLVSPCIFWKIKIISIQYFEIKLLSMDTEKENLANTR